MFGDTFGFDCCILVQGVTKLSPKPSSFCDAVPLGIEICMRIAHGYSDGRMSEQLLDCHYIHASIHEPGSERMPQRMPRHTLDSGLSARQSKTRLQIDKWISGFVVIENEFVLPSQRPIFQYPPCFRLIGTGRILWVLWAKTVKKIVFQIHSFPGQRKNFPDTQARIQGKNGNVLNIGSCVCEKTFFLLPGQGTKTQIDFLEELYFPHGIRSNIKVPIDGQIEHMLEKGQFPVNRRT